MTGQAGFPRRSLGRTGLEVGPLGLAASYGVPAGAVERGFEAGMNYLFWASRRTAQFAAALRKGDEVWVPKLRERFLVHAVRKKDKAVVLVRGSMRIELPFADVSWLPGA